MKQIAVIIPLVEWTDYVLRSVNSALSANTADSKSQNVECVVVVNRDEDASRIQSAFPNQALKIVTRSFCSLAEGFNLGCEVIDSEFVMKLNPANILMDSWSEAAAETIALNPNARMFFGAGFEVDQNDLPHNERNPRRPSLRNLRSRVSLVEDAVLYDRRLFQEFGGLDATRQFHADFEFALRLAMAKIPMAEIKAKIIGNRVTYVRRRATPEEMGQQLFATNEAIEILKSYELEPADRWILHRAAIEADLAGHTRLSSILFDRHVFQSALNYRLAGNLTSSQKLTTAISLALEHARIESNHLLKRPRFAARFFRFHLAKPKTKTQRVPETPTVAKPAPVDRPSRRIFQLKYEEPTQLLIPKRYHQKRSKHSLSISIVTPNLNQGVFIERTLTSVLDQQYPKLEYVVQDGCSRDNSVAVIRQYESQISSWQSVKDHGQSHAINMGLERTSGDIMAYLNSDDILLPGSLDYVAKYFEQHPEVDVVYGDRLLIDEEDRVINYWVLPEHDSGAIAWADFIPQETMFWRRSAWDSIGSKVDESFHFAMDWDMILRFRSQGKRFAHLPRFLGAFRITESQKTNQLQASVGQQDMNRLRKRELGYVPSDIEIAHRMEHYVQQQKKAERRYQIANSVTKIIGGLTAWTPTRSDCLPNELVRAA
ncbi:MAG: glycosyltransferase [Planctomycetota bacterium]|nr:glycosyltransferase [Planctomycetota bacterium]